MPDPGPVGPEHDARVPVRVRAELVAAAAGEDTDATRRRVRQAEADHCVERAMERFERQRQARGAGWQRDHEGMLRLWAKLDPEVGAAVEANLEALRRQYWLDDKQVRNGRRTPAQRDADVLAYTLAGVTLVETGAEPGHRLRVAEQLPHQRSARCGIGPVDLRLGSPPVVVTRQRTDQLRRGTDAEPAQSEFSVTRENAHAVTYFPCPNARSILHGRWCSR
ncbi:hypothetical protein [Candidatus Poriferisodalis sp.]|uniref:hypothetical protein n=1 Tax=Candidatus Poriferisodalis sp. TaxID=3101277 RepID=UPI003B01F15B